MRALPVQPEPLCRTDFRQRIAVSLWFLPTFFAAAAIAAANLTIWLDARVDAPIGVRLNLVSNPGSAATFAGAIAAATLAFVAVVFATTLVAIQLAASQYLPTTVRIFIRSRITRVTLGLFLATFVFSVIILPVTGRRSRRRSSSRRRPLHHQPERTRLHPVPASRAHPHSRLLALRRRERRIQLRPAELHPLTAGTRALNPLHSS